MKRDVRVKAKPITWLQYTITYFVLLVLSAGQGMIYAEYMAFDKMPLEYIFGMLGYWALVSVVFCLVTHYQIRKRFSDPMRRMSQAAKEVAAGDFTVHMEPIHPPEKYDYLDVMFEDFNKMVDELGSIEMLTNDFISNVSHEVKTPIAVIQNYAMALQKLDITPEQRQEYTETIINAAQRLNSLVSNILKLNKLENQKIVPALEEYDLCAQLTACALTFEDLWEVKNITFNAEMDDKAIIRADKSMLEIVWNNLLANAIKFTDSGGSITLTQTSDDDSVTVTISDTGCGMKEETLKRIFDKFYQGDTSRSQDGNGLGLALALRVIELLNGQISAESKPGEGSTFVVKLKTGE
ncbi:MAG: HAMP domain-containing histidine kinase [Oscillospiraceae bacterium]|nr:HAMP domain-containing histidine kinase [Oscillospiraceae bacterium]